MQHQRPASFDDGAPSGTAAGIAIALCALATIFAVAHHPTVSARAPTEVMTGMLRVAAADRIVHGTLIAIMAVLLYGFVVFSLRRGLDRETTVAGLVAFAIGVASLIGAAVIDGFLFPALAEHYAGASADAVKATVPVLAAGSSMVQILSKLGFSAMSTGVAFWSAGLLATRGVVRATGVIGLVSALGAAGLLMFAGRLNPHSLGAIVLVQAVWYVAVAVLLIRGRI